ncbi:MAG: CBS domain-containing protein [Bacteroidia bacterium]|nr:CBS domain-containing protein [Bacteroidia bacterium]NNF31820.1 CBS domain-containing protein [Flavobacteriaceae bacterium]MBT8276249.1 CBS domain-containing protein [Bacteroidia bacterium]NNJ81189.1 CBS domain-containing protein [Flavobacteriaceae bacterium]NNK53341.1 CBS domain-containing protein [Flavobacteriaceae bacterium]
MASTPVSSIMTKNVVCVTPDQKLIDVKHIYEKIKFHHHIPVTENDKLVGMVSLIDFMYRIKGAGLDDSNKIYHELTVKDIMSPNPYAVAPETSIDEIAEVLVKGRYRAIPIVESEKIAGIISTADVIKYYLHKD